MSQSDIDAAQKAFDDALAVLPTSLQMQGTTGEPGQPYHPGEFVNVQQLALSDISHDFNTNNLDQTQAPLAALAGQINLVRQLARALKALKDNFVPPSTAPVIDQPAVTVNSNPTIIKAIGSLFNQLADNTQ